MEKPKGLDELLDYDEYKAYIFSETWNAKRNERLMFDDFKCALCGNRNNVQVHHLVYPIHKNYGTESINDLITVCPECHKLLDGLRKGQRMEFSKFYKSGAELSCWISFDSHDDYLSEREELEKNFDMRNGDIYVTCWIKKEKRQKRDYWRITISTYVALKEKYGDSRVRISINKY